jgi:hypothetical protein
VQKVLYPQRIVNIDAGVMEFGRHSGLIERPEHSRGAFIFVSFIFGLIFIVKCEAGHRFRNEARKSIVVDIEHNEMSISR